jgi:phospholipid transport system substrate-binding protein
LSPTAIQAGEPTEQIRATIDKGLAVFNDITLNANGKDENIDRLREIVRPLFNYKAMARRSLGRHWRVITPEDRTEFVSVFTDFMEKTYVDKMGFYKGGEMNFIKEVVDNDYARVDVIVKTTKWADFAVSYKLAREEGNWQIYDILVENVSLINSYRVQFGRVITRQSYKELVEKIRQKTGEIPLWH